MVTCEPSQEFRTDQISNHRRLRRVCAFAQSHQSLRWSHTCNMELVENRPYQTQSFRKPYLQIILVDFRMRIFKVFSLYYGKENQTPPLVGGHLGKGHTIWLQT